MIYFEIGCKGSHILGKGQILFGLFHENHFTSTRFDLFPGGCIRLADPDAVFVLTRLLTIETHLFSGMRLCHIGNLKTLDLMFAIPVQIPQVEYMLYIFNRIDVTIDIHIVIKCIDASHKFRAKVNFHPSALVDRTGFVVHDPVVDGSVVDREDIRRLPTLCVDHRPDRATIALHLSVVVDHTEVTTSKIAHRTLHPRLYIKLRIHTGHLLHLDSQS